MKDLEEIKRKQVFTKQSKHFFYDPEYPSQTKIINYQKVK